MAAAHVQNLGSVATSVSATTTVISPSSKTVTAGGLIVVGVRFAANITPTGVTDNLGNTYARSERITGTSATCDMWSAPVTTGGSITTITVTHPTAGSRMAIASEFSGVGALAAAGGGAAASSTTCTWVTSKTIPANGIAIGVISISNNATLSVGAASGTPSTSISCSAYLKDDAVGRDVGIYYAIAGTSAVTTFTGTTTLSASSYNAGAGGLFNPAAAAVKPNFLPFFWA